MFEKMQSASLVSLGSNLVLSALKILTGLFGHSYALVADGIESLADCVSSLIVWNGIRVGSKEADHDHPYGHGKAESIATLLAGVGLLLSGVLIASQAIQEMLHPQSNPELFTVPILILIIAFKEGLFQFMKYHANKHNSGALMAEAVHHRSDSLTSLCVLVGLSIAVFSGGAYANADDFAALLVTVLIFRNGWRIAKPAIDELMDKRIVGEEYEKVLQVARQTPGVLEIETLWIRQSGRHYHVDVHLEVDSNITVAEGHQIAHRVKENLMNMTDVEISNVGTHVEPHQR